MQHSCKLWGHSYLQPSSRGQSKTKHWICCPSNNGQQNVYANSLPQYLHETAACILMYNLFGTLLHFNGNRELHAHATFRPVRICNIFSESDLAALQLNSMNDVWGRKLLELTF